MATDFQKTADNARQLLRGFKAVSELADAFENAGSVVQASAEAQRTLDKLRPQVEELQSAVARAKSDAKHLADAAKVKAGALLDTAQATAEAIVQQAEAEAKRVVDEANTAADAASQAADKAHAELEAASQAKQLAEQELASIEARIAKAKAAMVQLLTQE